MLCYNLLFTFFAINPHRERIKSKLKIAEPTLN